MLQSLTWPSGLTLWAARATLWPTPPTDWVMWAGFDVCKEGSTDLSLLRGAKSQLRSSATAPATRMSAVLGDF